MGNGPFLVIASSPGGVGEDTVGLADSKEGLGIARFDIIRVEAPREHAIDTFDGFRVGIGAEAEDFVMVRLAGVARSGRGFGEKLRTGDGELGSEAGSAAARISEIASEGLATLKARTADAAAAAEAAARESADKVEASTEKIKTAVDKSSAVGAAKTAVEKAGAAAEPKVAGAAAKVAQADSNVAQWGKWLADQLRQRTDLQSLGALRLSELADRAPAPVGAAWQTARAVLEKDYGKFTVAELLKRFG